MAVIVCRTRLLTSEQARRAVRRSVEVNPANAIEHGTLAELPAEDGSLSGARPRLGLIVGRRWPAGGTVITVQFLDNPSPDLRRRILLHLNAWGPAARVRFEETRGVGMLRLSRCADPPALAGCWSYIGTEILAIEEDLPTMNLQGFTMRTSEAEFRRVVRHQAGHTLGFEHEHLPAELVSRIDRRKAVAHFRRELGWSAQQTTERVLTPRATRPTLGGPETEALAIMAWQIPAGITKDGQPIAGGSDIGERDFARAASLYPGPVAQPATTGTATAGPDADADALHIVIMDAFNPKADGSDRRPAEDLRWARIFASYGGARVTSAMRLRKAVGEAATRFPGIIATHERIKDYTNRERGTLPGDEQLIEFGKDLFETLIHGDVRRLYDEARARQQGRKLDLVLTSMIPWIAEKPWEFAYDATRRSFLATEEIHFVRNVLTAIPADPVRTRAGPLRVLVAAAQPVGFGRLSVAQEVAVIRRGFEALVDAGLVIVDVLGRATPAALHTRLASDSFDVVHFIGHGSFDDRTQEAALVFEDESGRGFPLGERSTREIFCQRGLSLVFLNACQSGSGGRADFNKGIAQALVSHGLPALVANQYSVLDVSATSFAQHFYGALARGMGIGQAAREGRIAVNYSMQGELIDWAVPVVYARDPDMRLRLGDGAAPARTAGQQRRPRSGHRVGVWDIDNVFPALEQTLDTMNAAQPMFAFEFVDLSAPVDAWDLEHRAPDGRPYLWAERLARRLERSPVELQVDLLACITRHGLRSDEQFDRVAWWPAREQPPVLVLSCAGLETLAAEGRDSDCAVAQALVSALAGYLGSLAPHGQGPVACPLAIDAARPIKQVAGPQRFDRRCRAALKQRIPAELPALDVLLKLFR